MAERTATVAGQEMIELGRYHTESQRIRADLHICIKPSRLGEWYYANFRFYTEPVWMGDKEGFNVSTEYSSNVFVELFERIKRSEKGIELLLASPTDHNWDCRSATDVVKCILSLEEQAGETYLERKQGQNSQ